jgi:hypothetical protein
MSQNNVWPVALYPDDYRLVSRLRKEIYRATAVAGLGVGFDKAALSAEELELLGRILLQLPTDAVVKEGSGR